MILQISRRSERIRVGIVEPGVNGSVRVRDFGGGSGLSARILATIRQQTADGIRVDVYRGTTASFTIHGEYPEACTVWLCIRNGLHRDVGRMTIDQLGPVLRRFVGGSSIRLSRMTELLQFSRVSGEGCCNDPFDMWDAYGFA
jgi:hypothetical protein